MKSIFLKCIILKSVNAFGLLTCMKDTWVFWKPFSFIQTNFLAYSQKYLKWPSHRVTGFVQLSVCYEYSYLYLYWGMLVWIFVFILLFIFAFFFSSDKFVFVFALFIQTNLYLYLHLFINQNILIFVFVRKIYLIKS